VQEVVDPAVGAKAQVNLVEEPLVVVVTEVVMVAETRAWVATGAESLEAGSKAVDMMEAALVRVGGSVRADITEPSWTRQQRTCVPPSFALAEHSFPTGS